MIKNSSGPVKIIAPPPKPADALTGFASNASSLGTLVLVIVAAASVAIDARPALAAFYRSRVARTWMLLLPRCVVVAIAAVVSLLLGLVCVWYETDALIGSLPFGALAAGFGVNVIWLGFCVSLVAFWASIARGVMPVIGTTLASLLALVFLGGVHVVSTWLPTSIASSAAVFVGPHTEFPWRASLVTAVATVVLATGAAWLLGKRAE